MGRPTRCRISQPVWLLFSGEADRRSGSAFPPENIIARKLKWKPARLIVTTVPPAPKVRIMVRDPGHPGSGTVVAPGEEVNIPFFPNDEGQKEVDVSIGCGGRISR